MSDASGTPLALHVRPAETADAAGIARVHVEGWRAAYRGLLPQAFLDDLSVESRTQFWQRAIQYPLPRSISHVAIHNDEVVGFCACGPAAGTDAPENRGEIAAIYVDPALWRLGIGRTLMDAALDHLVAQGFHDVTLWVLDANDVGRQFYERYGWTNEDITKVDRIGDTDVIEIRYRLNLAGW